MQKVLYRYPYLFGLLIFAGLAGVVQILVILDCFFPLIEYATDAVSSVMSTCSEVLAGLYGITLTGYIFFADRFKDTSDADESLYDAVQALLLRYNHMAGFISLMCLVCIVMAEGIVLYGANTLLPGGVYRFWVNETLLLCFCTFDLILYFVISVLDPHKVKRISSQKKAKLSEDTNSGDMEEFIAAWNEIETNLFSLRDELVSKMRFIPGGNKGKPQVVQTLEILRNYGRINFNLWKKLDRLRQYHNLSLHDVNMAVSQEMCDLAKDVLEELQTK
ncbi:MAG: ABC transporter ATP-binding protein [Oscillospiraceae bacterium]|nr:ABC transporter ATP-binding protein [Oscillospiraceae bacterium]